MSHDDREDDFSLWYRFKATVIFNLLQVSGPAKLNDEQDPRVQVEREYLRRKALHRERKGLPPLPPPAPKKEFDPVIPMAVFGALVIVGLIVWAVVAG
jgi:hypothetical protein